MVIKFPRFNNSYWLLIVVLSACHAHAQEWKEAQKVNLVFGLSQPLAVKGFNVEGNYIYRQFIFDYSHGISLDFSGAALTTELKDQELVVHMPWTTGFGVGYRLKEWLNVRVEPKWHRFEFYYSEETQNNANKIVSYTTTTLGVGLYGHFQPFKNSDSFLSGIMIAPSIRFWPTIRSILNNDKFNYTNKRTSATEEIKTLDPGFGFTPWVLNVSIGYSFDL